MNMYTYNHKNWWLITYWVVTGCLWNYVGLVMFRKREAKNSFVGPLDKNVALVPQL